jgi:hypothetical protein
MPRMERADQTLCAHFGQIGRPDFSTPLLGVN